MFSFLYRRTGEVSQALLKGEEPTQGDNHAQVADSVEGILRSKKTHIAEGKDHWALTQIEGTLFLIGPCDQSWGARCARILLSV